MSEQKNRPRYYVSARRSRGKGKDQWIDLAVILKSRSGDGFDILVKEDLSKIKANDWLYLRKPNPKVEKSSKKAK